MTDPVIAEWERRMFTRCECTHTRLLHGKRCEVPSCPCREFRAKR